MKKNGKILYHKQVKLKLSKESIRLLSDGDLARAYIIGAAQVSPDPCNGGTADIGCGG